MPDCTGMNAERMFGEGEKMTPEELRHYIARLESQREALERRYSGVRPGWVSAESAAILTQIRHMKEKLNAQEERPN